MALGRRSGVRPTFGVRFLDASQQMQSNRANFETDYGSAIHSQIQDTFTELIGVTLEQYYRACFEQKQARTWQYCEWAVSSGEYNCSLSDIEKIRIHMPHWLARR